MSPRAASAGFGRSKTVINVEKRKSAWNNIQDGALESFPDTRFLFLMKCILYSDFLHLKRIIFHFWKFKGKDFYPKVLYLFGKLHTSWVIWLIILLHIVV